MSKAFTRESVEVPEQPVMPKPLTLPGGKNYITPDGAQKLRDELERLSATKEVAAGSPNAKQNGQWLPQRIFQLQQSLSAAVIVPPPTEPWDQVLFGATVTVRDHTGEESRYRIVGVDETDLDRNWVSWLSPVAKALLKSRLGQKIRFRTPAGEQQWEIVAITHT